MHRQSSMLKRPSDTSWLLESYQPNKLLKYTISKSNIILDDMKKINSDSPLKGSVLKFYTKGLGYVLLLAAVSVGTHLC